MTQIASVILAAGKGTRMKSALAKPLHKVCGLPLVTHAQRLAKAMGAAQSVFVVGHDAEAVGMALGPDVTTALQAEQLGTGHAVMQAEAALHDAADLVLVWAVDMPLLRPETMQALVAMQLDNSGPISMLTVVADNPRGFGRIVRDAQGAVVAIVEEADATPEQRAIRELNAGVYCFDAAWLWQALRGLPVSSKGEYYLTDTVAVAVAQGHRVLAHTLADRSEAIGINTRVHLAEAEAAMRQRINTGWMLAGVTLVDPASTYVGPDVQIGADTVILPGTHLEGTTVIGSHCVIGPNTIVRNTRIGDFCEVEASVLEDALMEDHCDIGPFGHLRKGAHLAEGVHMGNFGEVKNSYLGPGVKMGHFSYMGDAEVGARTNIGAGTITCNFGADKHKHRTVIGEDAYIGSDTMLVAPLTIGERGMTGAGAVVTRDIPANSLAVGVPAKVIRQLDSPETEDASS